MDLKSVTSAEALAGAAGDELVEAWLVLTRAIADRALVSPDSLVGDVAEGPTFDEQIETLEHTRRSLERAAEVASLVSRSADAVMRVVADAHEGVVRQHDHLSWTHLAGDDSYPLAVGEFAADSLAPVLGMRSGSVASMADDAATLRSRHPWMLAECLAGRARFATATVISDELDHIVEPEALARVTDLVGEVRCAPHGRQCRAAARAEAPACPGARSGG